MYAGANRDRPPAIPESIFEETTDRIPSRTILIVEDDEDVRESVAELLTDEGFRVETACDGEQALALLKKRQPDLMLLDLMMPNRNGWELLDEINRRFLLSRIPIVIITASPQTGGLDGRYQVLKKPLRVEPLMAAIRGALA